VALVVVLWTVALLATVTAVASSAARRSAELTVNLRAQAMARAMAESGVLAARALIDDSLRALGAGEQRNAFLSRLEPEALGASPLVQDTLGDGIFAVTVVDVSARLDINSASEEGLSRLFATAGSPATAREMAHAIAMRVLGEEFTADDAALRARDSLTAVLLGREWSPRQRRPFESLDELRDLPGADLRMLSQVAPFLTVDGDGRTNRRAAPREVLASAAGSLVDAPTRLLLIARGWQRGQLLTRQIEAVYDVAENGLQLVRWREHDR
jgi:type II secretory pathway component PulK